MSKKWILAARSHLGPDRESVEEDEHDLELWDGLTRAYNRAERLEGLLRDAQGRIPRGKAEHADIHNAIDAELGGEHGTR